MKRYFIALGAAAFVGSTVLASAAALDVDGGVAQTGRVTQDELTCDESITVKQFWETDAPVPSSLRPQYYDVNLANCQGENIVANAYSSDGKRLGHSVRTVPAEAEGADGAGDYFRGPAWEFGPIPLEKIDYINVTIIS